MRGFVEAMEDEVFEELGEWLRGPLTGTGGGGDSSLPLALDLSRLAILRNGETVRDAGPGEPCLLLLFGLGVRKSLLFARMPLRVPFPGVETELFLDALAELAVELASCTRSLISLSISCTLSISRSVRLSRSCRLRQRSFMS